MDHHSGHVFTLANSIIGVSLLAMPYCFKQCGILLAFVILVLCNLLTRLSCHFLIKSAIVARRRTFEYLAYYIFGGIGKFSIEVGMIGFLIGTCIAFFVVMGDLGPEIISELTGQDISSTMRTSILMALALFCVLPLGLLRNVDSLGGVSRATIGFYFCLVLSIVLKALPHFFSGNWIKNVEMWRPLGIIQCLPIFSMALSCQSQLFEIYQVINNPNLDKMNHVVKTAVNICTAVYMLVGFFGYIAFSSKTISGNVLLSFSPSLLTSVIKLGFVLSIAFSFPLVIFPCRASLHSLIYREGYSLHEGVSNYIPEGRFKGLTLLIVFLSLIVGIMIPNIELVLGLVGSTIGIIICILFPVTCFIYISEKNTNERLLAKLVLAVGFALMVLGTYENLHRLENIEAPIIENLVTEKRGVKIVDPLLEDLEKNIFKQSVNAALQMSDDISNKSQNVELHMMIEPIVKITDSSDIRHEPPQPVEPQDSQPEMNNLKDQSKKMNSNSNMKLQKAENLDVKHNENVSKEVQKNQIEDLAKIDKAFNNDIKFERKKFKSLDSSQDSKKGSVLNHNETKNDEVDIEAIRKDDTETLLQQKDKSKDPHLEDHKILLDTIEKQHKVHEEIVKQQKKLIEVIEKHQELQVKEEKLKAVKEIESIALKAIERISGNSKENRKIVEELERDVKNKTENKNMLIPDKLKIENIPIKNVLLGPTFNDRNKNIEINKETRIVKNSTIEKNKQTILEEHLKINNHVKNKTAPLLLNLGVKENTEEYKSENIPNKALTSQSRLPNNDRLNDSINSNILKRNETRNYIDSNNNEVKMDEMKIMRRDILAYMITKRRRR